MSDEMQSLKEDLKISDSEWEKIEKTKDAMYGIWENAKSEGNNNGIGIDIERINKKFHVDNDIKGETIYNILCDVCGKNIHKDLKKAELQIPPLDKEKQDKKRHNKKWSVLALLSHIRELRQENNADFNELDIKLTFLFMYGIMSSEMPKKSEPEKFEQEKTERKKKICLYAACMGVQSEEFSDVLNIIQYLLNITLNIGHCESGRTSFLEQFCSGIIENTSDMDGDEEKQEDILKNYFKAGHTLIYIRTLEESEVVKNIQQIVKNNPDIADKAYEWNVSDGIVNLQTGIHREDAESCCTLEHAIESIFNKLESNPGIREIYIFRTIEKGIKDENTIPKIKILAEKIKEAGANVFLIFLAKDVYIDSTLEGYFHIDTSFYYPKTWRIKEVLDEFWESKGIYFTEPSISDDIAYSCKGLTTEEIKRALELAYVKLDGRFEKDKYLQVIQDAKKQSLQKRGLLDLISQGIIPRSSAA